MFTTTCLPVDFCSVPGVCEFLPQTGSGEWHREPLFQLNDFFENMFLCLQGFSYYSCMTTSRHFTHHAKRVFSGLGPPVGEKSFVIKQANRFPKMVKDTHAIRTV